MFPGTGMRQPQVLPEKTGAFRNPFLKAPVFESGYAMT
jgi:hypothetical protein